MGAKCGGCLSGKETASPYLEQKRPPQPIQRREKGDQEDHAVNKPVATMDRNPSVASGRSGELLRQVTKDMNINFDVLAQSSDPTRKFTNDLTRM